MFVTVCKKNIYIFMYIDMIIYVNLKVFMYKYICKNLYLTYQSHAKPSKILFFSDRLAAERVFIGVGYSYLI